MKLFLALSLFVGVALGNSMYYYGWQPHQELLFRYESKVNSAITEIRKDQKAGIRLVSEVRVQTSPDYSLIVKFENPRFLTFNSYQKREQHDEPIPQQYLEHLQKPFKVHLKRGVVEEFFVDQEEPVVVTNIKKAFLANMNLDMTASQRPHSNNLQTYELPVDQSYFSVREQSLHGECQTAYTVHPLPEAEAYEIEEKLEHDERKNFREEGHLPGGYSQGKEICRGKQYYQITKTKEFDNCRQRPVYQKFSGLKSKCDLAKSACKDLMNHVSATNIIVCGSTHDFIIRKIVTENTLMTNLAWKTEQKFINHALVTLEVLRKHPIATPMTPTSSGKTIKNLIFEFPEKTYSSPKSINDELPEQEKERIEQETGIKPVLPKPDLKSAPKWLIPSKMDKSEVATHVTQIMQKVAQEIYESPESCSSKGDTVGYLSSMTKLLRQLSFDELKYVDQQLESHANSQSSVHSKAIKILFNDVIAMVGTNPAVMLIKEKLKYSMHKYSEQEAIKMLQFVTRSVETPTQQLLQELVNLVKHDLKQISSQHPTLYTVGLVQVSNLLYKACVNPESKVKNYPAKMYGPFCPKDAQVLVQEWIPFLVQEVEQQQNKQVRLVALTALGKTGHMKALQPLLRIVSSKQYKPIIRTLAVHSMKRIARIEPIHVKPVLLSIIDNPSDAPEVRIAAVAVLPFAQPTVAELQKMAVRSWFEPSKEVASFIYSTLYSLPHTQVPELKLIGLKAKPLLSVVKPYLYGGQYSKNIHYSKFVKYLEAAISQKYSWISVKESLVPLYQTSSTRMFGGAFEFTGLSFTAYTKGMDKYLDQILYYVGRHSVVSREVEQQLREISSKLNIEQRTFEKPELFAQYRVADMEYNSYMDETKFINILERISEELRRNPDYLNQEVSFKHTNVFKTIDVESILPSDAGFPIYVDRALTTVYAIKGNAKMTKDESRPELRIPKEIRTKITPVINIKIEATVGVVSPFTKETIGAGVDLAVHQTTPIELKLVRQGTQLTVIVKSPKEVTGEIEAFHTYIKPFTYKKSLRSFSPASKSASVVPILTGVPLKKMDVKIGQSVDLEAKLIAESDDKYTDLYSFYQKYKQQSYTSMINTFFMTSELRARSIKILFNPQQSRTKEVSFTVSLVKAEKDLKGLRFTMPVENKEIVNDINLIRHVCQENYPKDTLQSGKCILQLSALEVVSDATKEICSIHPFANCHKYAEICHQAKMICETKTGLKSAKCQEMKHTCLNRILNLKMVHKTLMQMSDKGEVVALRMDVAARSESSQKSAHVAFAVGTSGLNREYKFISNLEVKTSSATPLYEVKLEADAKVPFPVSRWNKDHLLDQALEVILNGKLEYGIKGEKKVFQLISKMTKTQQQKESVRQSPEYKRCALEESRGNLLTPICEKSRHQAASIDMLEAEVKLPMTVASNPIFYKLGELIRAQYFAQMYEENDPSNTAIDKLKIEAKVSRTGEEGQILARIAGRKYKIANIRLPHLFKSVFPVSVRNPLSYNLVQKVSRNQIPSSCRVEPQYVATFDNKTYPYEMNNCYHLLFKDCANKVPVAVMAKSHGNNPKEKELLILSGYTKVEVVPNGGASGLSGKIYVEGQVQPINMQPNQIKVITHNSKEVLKVKRYQDNVYLFEFPLESLWVLTNGQRIEVSAPQMLKSKTCGLCGDMNGENTNDLMTPKKCQMSKPRYSAYSYMIKDQCQGIPSQDRPMYEKELNECVRNEIIPTPVTVIAPAYIGTIKPLVSYHIVQKFKTAGKVCISIQKTPVRSGSMSVETIRERFEFVCLDSATIKARQLVQMAKSGETLTDELTGFPIAYSKVEYAPIRSGF